MLKAIYTFGQRGNQFAVLKWTYGPTGDSATCVEYCSTKQDAYKKVKELNNPMAMPHSK